MPATTSTATVANHVYNTAARDGTVFATTGRTAAIEPLLGNRQARFDAQKFNWLGTANVSFADHWGVFAQALPTSWQVQSDSLL